MSDDQVTFDDLLIDEEELNENLLAETLIDYLRIGSESGSLVLEDEFEDLTSHKQVTVVLLAQHALEGVGMADGQWLTPTEIAERSGVKRGTVYPAVRELDSEGIVENDDGSYRIPTHSIEAAKRFLTTE
jgi:hypothetical protein